MILKINGIETDYDSIHRMVEEGTYDSVGEAIMDKIKATEWYQHPNDFNVFQDYKGVQNLCNDDVACWMDAVNRSVMEQSVPTKMMYRFISHRVGVIKEGFSENFLPEKINWETALNLIDWHFLLDCILWFM